MKIQWNRRYNTIAVYVFLTVAASLLLMNLILNFSTFRTYFKGLLTAMMPFIYGFAIAYLLNPILRYLEDQVFPRLLRDKVNEKIQRGLSILLTYLFAGIIIGIFFWIVIPEIITSLTMLVGNISNYINQIQLFLDWLLSIMPLEQLPPELVSTMENWTQDTISAGVVMLTGLLPHLLDMTKSLSAGILNVVLGVIISIYMLMGKEKFFAQTKKLLCAFIPQEYVDFSVDLAHESNSIFGGFITGKIIDSLIIGLLCFMGLTFLNMPYSMLVSFIVGVTNVIPYFGPFIGAIPSFFLIVLADPVKGLVFLAFILVLQQFDGNILGPKILGETTGLSAFWVIFAIMFFNNVLGLVGMFIGVPTFAVIYSLLRRYINARLSRRGLSTETADYASENHKLLDD